MSRRAVFLDRDGVINVECGEHIRHPEDLQLLPGSAAAIAALSKAGWPIVVYTNQSGVGRGYMSMADLDAIHDTLRCQVEIYGGELTAIYACTHHPNEGCDCRKPKPGMLLQAASEHDLDMAASFAVGDSPRDIAAANAAGCSPVLVLSGSTTEYTRDQFPTAQPKHVFPDLSAFAKWLLDPSV